MLTDTQVGYLTPVQVRGLAVTTNNLHRLSAEQFSWLNRSQVQQLPYWFYPRLTSAQITLLTPDQIASIPSITNLSNIPSTTRAALTASQVQSLYVAELGVHLLTPAQQEWLSVQQVRSLPASQLSKLPPSKIPLLSDAQLRAINGPSLFSTWTDEARAALTMFQVWRLRVDLLGSTFLTDTQVAQLTTSQVRSLVPSTNNLTRLTDVQFSWLSKSQVQDLPYWFFPRLTAQQLQLLTTDQVASIPTVQNLANISPGVRAALNRVQIEALNVAKVGIHLLTPEQREWLTAAQVQSLSLSQLSHLPPSKALLVGRSQLSSINSPSLFGSWPADLRAALTLSQVWRLRVDLVGSTLLTDNQVAQLLSSQVRSLAPTTNNLSRLTDYQFSWLTAEQIQQLPYWFFPRLEPSQIPLLTVEQIASIPSTQNLEAIPADSRIALTEAQVQVLDVARLGVHLLTPEQQEWLTVDQVRSLPTSQISKLPPSKIPLLTTAQIRTIVSPSQFGAWPADARSALGPVQIWALRTDLLGSTLLTDIQVAQLSMAQVRSLPSTTNNLMRLTDVQFSWLTAAQIRQLPYWFFTRLTPAQIPLLTDDQVASIPSTQKLAEWSEAARAALTMSQVQSLDLARVGIRLFTPQQIRWLTNEQMQTIKPYEVYDLPYELSSVLSRDQVLSLSLEAYASLTRTPMEAEALANWQPMGAFEPAADGLAGDPRTEVEKQAILALVPYGAATHIAVKSGPWESPKTWSNGQAPGAGARVLIPEHSVVHFGTVMPAAIDTLRIEGELRFATDRTTLMRVDTIVVDTHGTLQIGSAAAPISSQFTASIRFPTSEPIDVQRDPKQLSRGIINRGRLVMHGAEVTPYLTLAEEPSKGDTTLQLTATPVNWNVGDRLVLAGTVAAGASDYRTEEVVIRAISGARVTIDPLRYDHKTPFGRDYSSYVANVSRNVILAGENENADPSVRPHLMFVHNPEVHLANIGVYGLGRTDKLRNIDPSTNVRGRYAVHFHRTGVDPDSVPATVRGSAVVGSPGWGFVNHQSHVVMEDNVAFQVRGSSFVTEDGNEVGAFRRNLSLLSVGSQETLDSRHDNHDFGHSGHGFWLQGPSVEVVDNIVAGSSGAAYVYYTTSSRVAFAPEHLEDLGLNAAAELIPVSAVPIKRFEGNEAIATWRGLELWHINRDLPEGESEIVDFASWNTRSIGIFVEYSSHLTLRDSVLLGPGPEYSAGIRVNRATRDVVFENLLVQDYGVGIVVPARGENVINGGAYLASQPVEYWDAAEPDRTIDFINSPVFLPTTP